MTRKFAVIGHPIGHTMSPFIHKRLFELTNIDAEYGIIDIAPENLKNMMNNPSKESIVKIESNNQFLTFNQLKNLYLINGLTLNDETYKHNLNLVTNKNKYNIMAELLSDNNAFSIKVAKFNGVDKINLVKRNEYGYKYSLSTIQRVWTIHFLFYVCAFCYKNQSCYKQNYGNAENCIHCRLVYFRTEEINVAIRQVF